MPWEVKRWVVFASLMAVLSLLALTFNPSCYGFEDTFVDPAGTSD